MNTGGNSKYEDIIELDRPISYRHPRMPIPDRAAQFSPFAALTGYEAAILETGRVTDSKHELSEEAKTLLDEKLQFIISQKEQVPILEITYFVADKRKAGGSYVTFTGRIKKIDEYRREVITDSSEVIPIDDIFEIDGDILKWVYRQ